MKSNVIRVKIEFSDPMKVSNTMNLDKIKVIFRKPSVFISEDMDSVIPQGCILKNKIQP